VVGKVEEVPDVEKLVGVVKLDAGEKEVVEKLVVEDVVGVVGHVVCDGLVEFVEFSSSWILKQILNEISSMRSMVVLKNAISVALK
jgi:hypothetical protein